MATRVDRKIKSYFVEKKANNSQMQAGKVPLAKSDWWRPGNAS